MGACSSCGAAVLWAKTDKGKNIPLDAEPSPKGTVAILDGIARVVPKCFDPARPGEPPLYISHFATCPNAAQHRRSK